MIEGWSPGRCAAQEFYDFSRGAIRWDDPGSGQPRFLVFGNPEADEDGFLPQELRLVREGLRGFGLGVCAFERYLSTTEPESWAFVVRPQELPRDGRAAWALEARLNALAWQAWCAAQGIPVRGLAA